MPLCQVADDWLTEYLRDQEIRSRYFVPGTELLREHREYHHGRLWTDDKIVVPQSRIAEVIQATM